MQHFFLVKIQNQLTQSRFKLSKFGNNKKEQTGKLIKFKDVIIDIANILFIKDNNCFLNKNNVEYAQAKFMQASKMIKRSMIIILSGLIWQLYKNI